MRKSDLVDIEDLGKHAETDKAICVSLTGETKDYVWLPKSQIEIEQTNDTYTVKMPEWLAIEKGLI